MNKITSQFIDLLWEMTKKELKVRYKNTTLGFLWVIIYPIVQAIIIGYIFRTLSYTSDSNYQYALFLNLLIWNFFAGSLENATYSIVHNRSIIKKSKFHYSVVPLSIVLCNAIHLLFSFFLFLAFVLIFKIAHNINVPLMIVGFTLLILLTSSLSLITSALNVRRRDIGFLIRAVLMILFYATPIVYSMSKVQGEIGFLWNFNPLTTLIMFIQTSIFNTPFLVRYLIPNSILIVFSFIFSIFTFRRYQDSFDDYI